MIVFTLLWLLIGAILGIPYVLRFAGDRADLIDALLLSALCGPVMLLFDLFLLMEWVFNKAASSRGECKHD